MRQTSGAEASQIGKKRLLLALGVLLIFLLGSAPSMAGVVAGTAPGHGLLAGISCSASSTDVALPKAPSPIPMFTQTVDPGSDGGSTCVSNTCYRVCRDGSVASVGCGTYENAYCGCDGLSHYGSVQAYTACTPCTP